MYPRSSLAFSLAFLAVVTHAQLAAPAAPPSSSAPSAPAPSAPSTSAPTPSVPSTSAPAPSSGSVISTIATANGTLAPNASLSSPPTFPVNIPSTNPTAVPLTSLVLTAPTQATVPLDTTVAAGAQPTAVSGAPPLPDISSLNPTNYPVLDKPPPTDNPLVQQWVQQVNASGFSIPNFPPTAIGGCPTNPQAVANPDQCWWTCSQCTRDTDVVTCPDKMTWGSSFDDGPSPYTPNLVQYLDEQQLKTTFFVVGSRVISRPDYLRSQYIGGHQIAVHTWSHTALTTQTNEEIIAEFGWSKKVIKDVIGVTPRYFRPPFGDIDDRVRAIAAAMDLTAIIWTSGNASNHVSFDTNDFNIPAGTVSASGVINNFNNILKNASIIDTGFIVLEHDLFQQSVDLATGYIIPEALAMNFKLEPIVTCLNKPLSDAYIETNNNQSDPLPSPSGTGFVDSAATTGDSSSTGTNNKKNGVANMPRVSWTGVAATLIFTVLGSVAVFQ